MIRVTPDGHLHRTLFIEPMKLEVRSPMIAAATVIGSDGKPVPPPAPEPSEVQRWLGLAEQEMWLDEALIYFGKATEWFDIYKALECLEKRFGGNETAFRNFASDRNWVSLSELELLKRTANWARHARRKFDPPPNPMELEEARELLGQLLRRALEEACVPGLGLVVRPRAREGRPIPIMRSGG